MSFSASKVDISGRLLAIDGLRGLAALAVVFFHLSGHLIDGLAETLPQWLITMFQYGYLGVPVFFVLSGFVISSSIKNSQISIRYVGRFALRRSVRLDPVYWCAIILSLVLLYAKIEIFEYSAIFPSVKEVLLHFLYLQDLFEVDNQISSVFWTLCLEIQFYLFFIMSIFMLGCIKKIDALMVHSGFVAVVSVISSLMYVKLIEVTFPGLFLAYWNFFALGCLCHRSLKYGGLHTISFAFLIVCGISTAVLFEGRSYIVAALACSLFIYCMALTNRLKNGLSSSVLQFLGLTSYSLYLTHPEIGWKMISVLLSFVSVDDSPFYSVIILLAGVVSSVIFGYIFYVLIERPSHKLSKRIMLEKNTHYPVHVQS